MKYKIFITLFLFTSMSMIAQKQEFIGVGINSEIMNSAIMRTGFTLSYENQLFKHCGFEVELNQRSQDQYLTIPIGNGTYQSSHIKEDYLNLPILYKFYSDIVNLSTGITFDYFVGWKDLTKFGSVELSSYSVDPKLYVGWVFKVSKTIMLSPKFILEPEIQFNPIFKYGDSYTGASLKLKYKL
jgi:hypothetical protein